MIVYDNNNLKVEGTIVSNLTFSHEIRDKKFYIVYIEVPRLSKNRDCLPVIIQGNMIDKNINYIGARVSIVGQLRSYDKYENDKRHLLIHIFAKQIEFIDEYPVYGKNQIELNGYICKKPIHRKTPYGKDIADMLLAVPRTNYKTDYIPCICWRENAELVSAFEAGTMVCVHGRIQSREYEKKLSKDDIIMNTVYEVSVREIEVLNEKDKFPVLQ